jgi:AbrB family looped-hinge helix DNA binding protein
MQTRVSTKGQVVLPGPIRRRLGIQAGDQLDVAVEDGRIVLARRATPALTPRIVQDPVSGMPVIDLGPNAPIVTNEQVDEILAEFP